MPTNKETFINLIEKTEDHLMLLKELGQSNVVVEPETLHALAQPCDLQVQDPQALSSSSKASLEQVAKRISTCTQCPLHESRTHTVPGQGSLQPLITFIGEGPGADEDLQGLAFVGKAGKLLTKIIQAMGFTREEVWIGNIVKCRPPGNRTPLPHEMESCIPYLREQIALLKPKVIVCLGSTAVKGLLDVKTGITKLRGSWLQFEGVDVMPTYHPAYLLRNPPAKKEVWEDMKSVLKRLGHKVPSKKT